MGGPQTLGVGKSTGHRAGNVGLRAPSAVSTRGWDKGVWESEHHARREEAQAGFQAPTQPFLAADCLVLTAERAAKVNLPQAWFWSDCSHGEGSGSRAATRRRWLCTGWLPPQTAIPGP